MYLHMFIYIYIYVYTIYKHPVTKNLPLLYFTFLESGKLKVIGHIKTDTMHFLPANL